MSRGKQNGNLDLFEHTPFWYLNTSIKSSIITMSTLPRAIAGRREQARLGVTCTVGRKKKSAKTGARSYGLLPVTSSTVRCGNPFQFTVNNDYIRASLYDLNTHSNTTKSVEGRSDRRFLLRLKLLLKN